MRGRNVVKFLQAIELLGRPTGATLIELMNGLDLKKRGAYRMLAFLQDEMKLVVHEDAALLDGSKRFYLDEEDVRRAGKIKVPNINLTLSEIIALYFLRGSSSMYQGTDIQKSIDKAFTKFDYYLPEGFGERLGNISGVFAASNQYTKDYSDKEDILDDLVTAISKRQVCQVTYHAFGENKIKTYQIAPLQLFERNGGLYLFAIIVKYGDIRLQAVERIQELKLEDETFEPPQDFDAEKLLSAAFGVTYDDPIDLKIWFPASQARYVKERQWAQDQSFDDHEDGSTILEMKTSGWSEVKRWLLSFGSEAKLLEPEELRLDMAEEVTAMKDCYQP
jgi:predicted DNA-binding transcriptional regulator YafY